MHLVQCAFCLELKRLLARMAFFASRSVMTRWTSVVRTHARGREVPQSRNCVESLRANISFMPRPASRLET